MPKTAVPTPPTCVQFPSDKLTLGAGVAIFHLATARVVLCYHTRDRYYFLPKGRKNANEALERAAEREGFEESGYRNRLLPLPMKHRATDSDEGREDFVTEPCWMQLLPLTTTAQYVLFWYVAETLPADVEETYPSASGDEAKQLYRPPPPFPKTATLRERIAQDAVPGADGSTAVYEPRHHEGTAQDEEEACYRSSLMSIAEAREKLRGSVMEDVVRRGWEGVQLRMEMEEAAAAAAAAAGV